jgi:hypothetical protein
VTAHGADIGFDLKVNPLVHLQITQLVESLLTPAAAVLSLDQMITAHMILQDGVDRVLLVTERTGKLCRGGVRCALVAHQRAFPRKSLVAQVTMELLLSRGMRA